MYIPFFIPEIETVNQEKLRDVLMGNISRREAHELKARMSRKRRKHLTVVLICGAAAVFCALLPLAQGGYGLYNDFYYISLSAACLAIIGAATQIPGISIPLQYLSALKTCRPGGRITFTAYRDYNLNKVDQRLLGRIAAYELNADEAGGLLNLAKYTLAARRKITLLLALIAAALAVFAFAFLLPLISSDYDNPEAVILLARLAVLGVVACVFGVIRSPLMARATKKYISALKITYADERIREREKLAEGVIAELRARTLTPTISLTAGREPTTAYASKLGGTPYLPPGFPYPRGADGQPLRLLAQLNLEELPRLPDFPLGGILQFYIADDDLCGMDPARRTRQKNFRVVYHKEIIRDASQLASPPRLPAGDACFPATGFPLEGEYVLRGKLEQMPVTPEDFRFYGQALPLWQAALPPAAGPAAGNLPNDAYDRLAAAFSTGGHRVGGYPFFTQADPRDAAALSGYTTLLLQIDSRDGITWGDNGVANFFIPPAKLRAGDFSDVLYTWDCY
ncbi:MAG: DUF1963 domain-containing protein [Peptococcaceae bacterium]|jgi:uncharacterized protein YwqG|nr:DUF1963 domain-containing protein [Peptococcaceae bacterium]